MGADKLKDSAAKLRLEKKFTKIEKLWKAARPKKSIKAKKLLPLEAKKKKKIKNLIKKLTKNRIKKPIKKLIKNLIKKIPKKLQKKRIKKIPKKKNQKKRMKPQKLKNQNYQ